MYRNTKSYTHTHISIYISNMNKLLYVLTKPTLHDLSFYHFKSGMAVMFGPIQ